MGNRKRDKWRGEGVEVEGEKYRNKEKEDQGENFEKLYISGGGKVNT